MYLTNWTIVVFLMYQFASNLAYIFEEHNIKIQNLWNFQQSSYVVVIAMLQEACLTIVCCFKNTLICHENSH